MIEQLLFWGVGLATGIASGYWLGKRKPKPYVQVVEC
jgi:Na+-driven multidrug efflux pump